MNQSAITCAWRMIFAVLCGASATASAAIVGHPPRNVPEDRPSDQPREYAETVGTSPHAYPIEFRGTVDGVMTPLADRLRRLQAGLAAQPLGAHRERRRHRRPQPADRGQRQAELAHAGRRGRRGHARLHHAGRPARAIWEFRRRTRFHATTWDGECSDAVKALNVYGYTLCGDEALVINDLWKAAGLTTRRGYPVGHCVTEVFYDGAYHLLDSDEHVICLGRDNRTIASEADVVRDHDLMKRTHTYGIGSRRVARDRRVLGLALRLRGGTQGRLRQLTPAHDGSRPAAGRVDRVPLGPRGQAVHSPGTSDPGRLGDLRLAGRPTTTWSTAGSATGPTSRAPRRRQGAARPWRMPGSMRPSAPSVRRTPSGSPPS